MKLLALEASAKAASCAVLEDGVPIATAWQSTGLTHSRTLLPMVRDMLRNSELTLSEMNALSVAVGPGSFTGLRIGIATVKGLAWAADKPCIPVSTLEAMAHPLAHTSATLVCAMDARRQQIYHARFRAEDGALLRIREDCAISLEQTAAELKDVSDPLLVVGDGAKLCADYLTWQGISCRLAPAHLRMQSAVGVGLAAMEHLGEAVDAQGLLPVYLRLSQAERERLSREMSTGSK